MDNKQGYIAIEANHINYYYFIKLTHSLTDITIIMIKDYCYFHQVYILKLYLIFKSIIR